MRGEDDSFGQWLGRQNGNTRLLAVIVIVLAVIGYVLVTDRIWPCRVSDGCDPNEPYDAADNQW